MHHCHEQIFEAVSLSSFFILGLLGSTHCVGMCGPLTCLFLKSESSKWSTFQYHLFRLLSYSIVAVSLSILGNVALKNMIWNRFSSFVLWAITVVVILTLFNQLIGKKIKVSAKIMHSPFFPAGLGLITGILPCGLLIPAYIGASSMPGKSMVLLAMALFFTGTLPALLMSRSILSMIRKRLPHKLHAWINPGLAIIFLTFQLWMMTRNIKI